MSIFWDFVFLSLSWLISVELRTDAEFSKCRIFMDRRWSPVP
jgi:hypothetical protein